MARGKSGQKVAGGGLAPWQVELVQRLLLRDLGADFPVAELAGRCGLSRSHFAKAFKASLGLSPHHWLVRQRIHRAGEMLERTNERISAIALNCGFSDQSHLTRRFRAMVGSSPAAWRRQRNAGIVPPIAPLVASPSLFGRRAGSGD